MDDRPTDDCKSMDCTKIRQLVFLYADKELGQELLVSFRTHVADCPHCAQEIRYTHRLLTLIRERATRWPAPRRLRARILAVMPHRRT